MGQPMKYLDRILYWIVAALVVACAATASFAEDRLAWGVNMIGTLGGVSDTWSVTTLAAANDPVTPRFRGSSMSGGWR